MEKSDNKTRIAQKITIEFNKIKHDVVSAHIAVGMVTNDIFDFFIRNAPGAKDISLVLGLHMPTPPAVFEKLYEAEQDGKLRARVFAENFFHPKLYVFELKSSWIAFVGSGNFTNGGWLKNEELFVVIENADTCIELKKEVEKWFEKAKQINEKFLAEYAETFPANLSLENQKRKNTSLLQDKITTTFNIETTNFTGQFFSKEHHAAFGFGKPMEETAEVLFERRTVSSRLYKLNDRLVKEIPSKWKIHPHYDPNYVVAHIENMHHHDYKVVALWVGYGRDKPALKKYGDEGTTPLNFMRMQVIISYDSIGVWLMPGKKGAGEIDRNNFTRLMSDAGYRETFYNLFRGLGPPYFIEIMSDKRSVDSFKDKDALWDYTQKDNWRYDYFIIGRDYNVGSEELKESNIVKTVISDFTKFFPLYEMIRDKTFG